MEAATGEAATAPDAAEIGACAGAVTALPNRPADSGGWYEPRKVKAKVPRKNKPAKTAVVRDKKFAEPDAPNKLPDDPLPKAAPMSAPLPC